MSLKLDYSEAFPRKFPSTWW